MLPLARLAYATPSRLVFDDVLIPSESGVQQGDPLGPILFSLAVDDIANTASSPLNVWYLDDATIGGRRDSVINDLAEIIPDLERIGLQVNPAKSELVDVDSLDPAGDKSAVELVLPGVRVTRKEDLVILGSPIVPSGIDSKLVEATEQLQFFADRLKLIDAHPALFLLKNSLSLPRLLFLLRSAPCFSHPARLVDFDASLRKAVEETCNIKLDDTGWAQAGLPVSAGGIGLTRATDIALPAYASSLHASQSLVDSILSNLPESNLTKELATVSESWNSLSLPPISNPKHQRCWSSAVHSATKTGLCQSADQHRMACLATAAQPHSGDWLNCIPSSSIGSLLDDDCIRFGLSLRLGLKVCLAHKCRCGAMIDEFGLHPLSCRQSAGRIPRHSALNEVVKRSLDAAGLNSILEPVGLDRGDGKRPDGITVFPFKRGQALVWDATCSDSFSPPSLAASASDPGSVSRAAEARKTAKYAGLSDRYHFVPIAVETSGIVGLAGAALLSDIGRRISTTTGDPRETAWLFQRVSLAIVRGNNFSLVSASRPPSQP